VSSWHLWWVLDPAGPPIASVAATLTVFEPPVVDRLYFWALQAAFVGAGGARHGAAHLGLQWNPRFPSRRAVNWGGYAAASDVSSILEGTDSPLPSFPNDPNTRDYDWSAGRPYRLEIRRGSVGWSGWVTDLAAGSCVEVRELLAGGDRLEAPVVWSEVFCRCDHPSVAVAWSDLSVVAVDGSPVPVRGVRTTFPTGGDCSNTAVSVEDSALVQRTNAARGVGAGAFLTLPGFEGRR